MSDKTQLPKIGDVWIISGQAGIITDIKGFMLYVCHAVQNEDGSWRAANTREAGAAALYMSPISRARFIELCRDKNGEYIGCWPPIPQ